jgi:coiled-coil domain-containing protein 130
MSERKATNKYYPPNFDPEKGSVNTQYKKRQSSGILPTNTKKKGKTVRLEMPFDVWCLSCNKLIVKGTRFNAEKKYDSEYLSTTIFRFHMNCCFCKTEIVMKTDPENRTYAMVSGLKIKTETWEFSKDDNALNVLTDAEREKLNDPFYKLEHQIVEKEAVDIVLKPVINELIEIQQSRSDDFTMNSILRKNARGTRKESFQDQIKYSNLGVPLVKESRAERDSVKSIPFVVKTAQSKQNDIRNGSIFASKTKSNNLIQNVLKSLKK